MTNVSLIQIKKADSPSQIQIDSERLFSRDLKHWY